jgi:hypothetical protein
VTADTYGRIVIPKQLSDAISWLTGVESATAWLFLIQVGRHRLLSDEQVQSDPLLEPVRLLIIEGRPPEIREATFAEEPIRAAMVARLMPAVLTKPKQGWRITIPKELEVFAPPEIDKREFSILMSLEGYLEIWYTGVLWKSGVQPLSRP